MFENLLRSPSKLFSASLLMAVPSASVNNKTLKDGNVELCRLFVAGHTC